jgi:hypothetical protein
MPGLGWRKAGEKLEKSWRKNIKWGPKDNFWKMSLYMKGHPYCQ